LKLTFKFNLIFVVIFGLGLAATGVIARRFLTQNARDQVQQQARLIMEASAATRTYTAQRVRPILDRVQREKETFFPESIPAFSAIRVFSYLHQSYPDYLYREAALNPTNPADRAVDWEADVIQLFRNDSSAKEFVGERETPNGRSLYLAKPMAAGPACLVCHSTPQAAPPAMVKVYGPNNGFGWKLDEIVAAQIVSVPMSIPSGIANRALWNLMLWLSAVAFLSLVLLNIALVLAVIRPVSQLSANADEISKGNLDVPEFPVKGKDEVSVLADAFNRMHRSLVKAMKMLED
jgi:HAMP domain-containing protein